MPWIKYRSYITPPAPSAFNGVLEISSAPFPSDELAAPVAEAFMERAVYLDASQRLTAYGWDGSQIYELGAAEAAWHEERAAQAGVGRWGDASGVTQNINQAAPTSITFTDPDFFDETLYANTSATTKTIQRAGVYRVEWHVVGAQAGAADINPLVELRVNAASQVDSRGYEVGVNNGDALTMRSVWEGALASGDALTFVGLAAAGTGSSLDTAPADSLLTIKRLGGV